MTATLYGAAIVSTTTTHLRWPSRNVARIFPDLFPLENCTSAIRR
jgi:hypothetical protein